MRNLLCKSLLLPLLAMTGLVSGCTRNMVTLYPLETAKEINGSNLTGKWLVFDDKGKPDPDGYIEFNWINEKKTLQITSGSIEKKSSSPPARNLPLTGKIYELDGDKFFCVTNDIDAIHEILKKTGYAQDLLLLQPIFCTLKIDIAPEQIILYMLQYGEDDAGTTDKDKFFSPKIRYDKKLQLIMNDSRELAEILHDKSYLAKKWLILRPMPQTEPSGLTGWR